ncbi:S1C family serine protease [Nocardia sp. CNY236]|uniref:S1C family serine protease n=1 Tax=Nocardia sp. CNY236 TaxID=1169152 RepID=UPI0003FF6E03|nr:trypsin-like peptidase domain-containing protein [Nocardia sp. CNY236]
MDRQWQRTTPNGTRGGRALVMVAALLLTMVALIGHGGEVPDRVGSPAVGSSTPVELAAPETMDLNCVTTVVEQALVNIHAVAEPFGAGAAGSGIVLTADGQVLTSHHVVKGADRVTVTDVGTGETYDAVVLGYDSDADIALLDLPAATRLPVATIGSSAGLHLSEEVLAIGNAGGTGGTPTAVHGPLTALDSTIVAVNSSDLSRKSLRGMLEVEAAITSGQSGGALVDRSASVVGVIAAASGDPEQVRLHPPNGYAVPIDSAMHVVEQIRAGRPTDTVHIGPTATLGVLVSDALPAGTGARVDVAVYDMPAQNAGMGAGDVIVSVDDHPVTSARAVRAELNVRKPNDTIRLGLEGAGGQRTVSVVLISGPPK